MNVGDSSERLARSRLRLAKFYFSNDHSPRRFHLVPDALSWLAPKAESLQTNNDEIPTFGDSLFFLIPSPTPATPALTTLPLSSGPLPDGFVLPTTCAQRVSHTGAHSTHFPSVLPPSLTTSASLAMTVGMTQTTWALFLMNELPVFLPMYTQSSTKFLLHLHSTIS